MGKAVFYSENSIMSPFIDALTFQHESMMEKGPWIRISSATLVYQWFEQIQE